MSGLKHLQIGNGLWESAQFNSRLQVTQLGLGTSATDTSQWKLDYDFGTTDNNGNIKAQTVTSPVGTYAQSFTYDSLDRLKTANETSGGNQTWTQSFTYDCYGNRVGFSQDIGGQVNNSTPSIDQNTNRFNLGQGYTYDAAGNVITDNQGRQFTFNGDNKQTEVKDSANNTVGTYFYDGDGKRIKKVTSAETTTFVYSGGKLVAEYQLTTATPTTATTQYLGTDMLGSPRVVSDQTGAVTSRRDFMPFGEDLTRANYGSDSIRQKFTGYEKDTETGLDFAEARYYNNAHGRFTAVDPLLASGKSANPQTFNRYVYTMNRPLILTDPQGLQAGTYERPPYFPSLKALQFAINNLPAARRIGTGSEPISLSSAAIRFSTRSRLSDALTGMNGEIVRGDGTQVNAVRHTIWQATITKEFSPDIAQKAGNAHERHPLTNDLNQRQFTGTSVNLQNADETIDLLNNRIGRQIGRSNPSATNNDLAVAVIEYYRDVGLFTGTINGDGSVNINQTRISNEQANNAINAIRQLDDNGRNAEEQRRHTESQNTTIWQEQLRLRRGERPQE